MSEITSSTFARHLDIDDVTYSAKCNIIKACDSRRTKPTAGILSLQISSKPFVKLTFQTIFQVQTFSLHPILYPINTLDIIKLTGNDQEKS